MPDKNRPALKRAPRDDEDLAERLTRGIRTERKTLPLKPKSQPPTNARDQSPRKKR